MKLTLKNLENEIRKASRDLRWSQCEALAGHLFKNFGQSKPKPNKDDQQQAERIYQLYPRKIGRGAAIKSILKQLKKYDGQDLEDATRRFAKLWENAEPSEMQFVPFPSTWFNQTRFLDDISIQGPKQKRHQLRGENI